MFSLLDAVQVVLAVAAYGALVALPGLTLARASGFGQCQNGIGALPGLLVGLAVLPWIDSLVAREIGVDGALAVVLVMAAIGLWIAAPTLASWRPSRLGAALVSIWLVIVIGEWIDIDTGGKLFQSFTVLDMVKHAATTQAILDSGAPPRDPFFLRPDRVGYYYFFYTPVALVQRLLGGLIDARAAVGGAIFWTGIGLYQLVCLTMRQAGIIMAPRRSSLLVIAVLLAGGLDILPILGLGFGQGLWLPDPVKWNTQITGWLESLFWVPHHLTALFAAILGLMVLSRASEDRTSRHDVPRAMAVAAACFASTLGLSVWVTLALLATGAVWFALIGWERRWRALAVISATGVLAMVFAAPQIIDLMAGRGPADVPPIALTVREFTPVDVAMSEGAWNLVARFVALPLNYFLGFGVLFLGAIMFWHRRRTEPGRPEFARVLAIAGACGLLLGAFLKSTMFNNDLGWRVALFPLLAGTVWTIAVLDAAWTASPTAAARWRLGPKPLIACLVLGWATSLYALAGLRSYPLYHIDQNHRFLIAHPETERGLRLAYAWADHNLPPNAVLQHDPTKRRAFAFALYGHNPTGVSDLFASIFGAAPHAVDARIAALGPIFHGDLRDPAIRAVAKANGIDALVVTKEDAVWSDPGSFVWRAKADYASPDVRIIAVAALGEADKITASVAR